MDNDSLEKWKMEMKRYKCELEKWKTDTQYKLEKWKTDTQCSLVIYQQVNMQGQAAMKAALLINGGASIAMLAFIGTAMTNGTGNPLLSKLCFSMLMFTLGVLFVAVAIGVTYLTGLQDSSEYDTDQSGKKWAPLLNKIAVFLVIIGYGLFVEGSLNAYRALTISLS